MATKYDDEAARRAARAIRGVGSLRDLRTLSEAISKRRRAILAAREEDRNLARWAEIEGLPVGARLVRDPAISVCSTYPAGVYTVAGFHNGRKHIGAWIDPEGGGRRIWLPRERAATFVAWDPERDGSPEAAASRERARNHERRAVALISRISGRSR